YGASQPSTQRNSQHSRIRARPGRCLSAYSGNVSGCVDIVGSCLALPEESLMKLADAVSLREMLKRYGPWSPEAALVVLKEALLELSASVRRGVVHRDCPPENVLIDPAGGCNLRVG